MKRELRPHQADALLRLRQSLLSGKRRPMICAPTGAGKTLLAAAVVDGALRKRKRVLFVVPAIELINQTVRAFFDEGITEVGVIQADHPQTNAARPVQVASVQTLERREIPHADIVVIDEAHRLFKFVGDWMANPEWSSVPFVGLSATPGTKGLGKHYDDLIIAATTSDLIDAGYLSPFRVYAPSHPDLSGVRTVAGEYHEGDLSEVMDKAPLVADVVETWLKLGENRPTLCFGVDRAHAKHLEQKFAAAGVPAAYVDAYTPPEERERIRIGFKNGSIKVVTNIGVLTTGVDWNVGCLILARPTKSEMLFVQIIGRALRTAAGKADAIILDHSDTHTRLGFVTDIHFDHLDDGRERPKADREAKQPLPKECPKCTFLRPAKVNVCPACGFKPERQNTVEAEDGELIEIRSGNVAKAPEPARAEKQRWYSSLIGLAAQRGYKPGWSANQYRQKFGVWPRGLDEHPIEPALDVVSYVRSRMIAYAKGKGRASGDRHAAGG